MTRGIHSAYLNAARATCNETGGDFAHDSTYVDKFFNVTIVIALLALFDHGILKRWVAKRVPKSRDVDTTRWFFVHSMANAFVCLASVNSMKAVALDPLNAFDGAAFGQEETRFFGAISAWPLTIINAVHIYHMIGGFRLSAADYFHHGVFIPTIALPGLIYVWGPLSNFQAFFISGLPGGIDYLLLGLQKVGMLSHLTEKRVNANLNIWLRLPGILIATVLCFQGVLYARSGARLPEQLRPPAWAMLLQLVLPPYNAIYYGKQAVANYAVHYMLALLNQDVLIKSRIEQRTSVTTGTEVMAWKDALGVPQRGS